MIEKVVRITTGKPYQIEGKQDVLMKRVSFGGGSGGGPTGVDMDSITKAYIDANDETTRAQNDARFTEVITGIDKLSAKIEGLPSKNSQTVTILGAAGALFLGVLAVLAFAGDRFDGGMSASTDAAVSQLVISEMDEKIDKLIDKQAEENQKMIDALADYRKGQKSLEGPEK